MAVPYRRRCLWTSVSIGGIISAVAFKMYDLDDDNKISRDELLAVLHMMVGANISDEQVRCSVILAIGHRWILFVCFYMQFR